mmetsp:Transcript_13275/g.29253  ORF Transcript_13275/g.29253 Transcript_13275/m.29253 type:complete len:228 (-) Transcript_13275:690-1373(-)
MGRRQFRIHEQPRRNPHRRDRRDDADHPVGGTERHRPVPLQTGRPDQISHLLPPPEPQLRGQRVPRLLRRAALQRRPESRGYHAPLPAARQHPPDPAHFGDPPPDRDHGPLPPRKRPARGAGPGHGRPPHRRRRRRLPRRARPTDAGAALVRGPAGLAGRAAVHGGRGGEGVLQRAGRAGQFTDRGGGRRRGGGGGGVQTQSLGELLLSAAPREGVRVSQRGAGPPR